MSSTSIAGVIQQHLHNNPQRIVVFDSHEEVSAQQMLERISRYHTALSTAHKNTKIALHLPTSIDALALCIAAFSLQRHVQFLDRHWPVAVLTDVIVHSKPDLVITDDATLACQNVPVVAIDNLCQKQSTTNVSPLPEALLSSFTSGSTGRPKECIRSESSWIASFVADEQYTNITPETRVFTLSDFSHSLGIYAALRALYAGASITLFQQFHPRHILEQLRHSRHTLLFGVPTQFDALTKAATTPICGVVNILSTGSKLHKRLIQAISTCFPTARIIEFYGASELSYVAARYVDRSDNNSLIGAPLHKVSLSILQPDRSHCAAGEVGAVYVDSPMLCIGYGNRDKISPLSRPMGVGDTGYIDGLGRLHLVGRIDRMFQCAGHNIYPEQIETALLQIPSITHGAVVGIIDDRRQHTICAVVSPQQPIARRDIVTRLQQLLPTYAIPQQYFLCQDWPLTGSFKTDLQKLKKMVESRSVPAL